MSTSTRICLVAGVLMAAACTVQKTPTPPLSGPSELGLRIALQVTPDSILQDGASQTSLQIEATGPDGRPVRGLTLRVEVVFEGVVQDFGTLSAKTVVTGEDGCARVIYTAPPRPSSGSDEANVITFQVTPIGSDFTGEIPRTASLRLVTPGVLGPPNTAPVALFTFGPDNATVATTLVFDASTSTDEGAPCGARCTYSWDFGDGGSASGIFATHKFQTVGPHQVRLTVTDARGASDTRIGVVTLGAAPLPPLPTAQFTFSPTNPAVSQTIFFNAAASRPGTGATLVSYDWDFGSGRTGSGPTTSKGYDSAGTYQVTLTVTDNVGQQATVTQSVTVGGGTTGPQARVTVSPTGGTTATNFFFDASGSTPGPSPIVEYRFRFGDNTPDVVGASATTSHRFTAPGTYTVTVTVRDSANRTSIGSVAVTVQ
jgi:PKD repeat protein